MKKILLISVLLVTLSFSYTVLAQEMGSLGRGYEIPFPDRIQKLLLDPLPAGTYSVGTTGYFPTIDSAFRRLGADGIAGAVALELIDNFYQAPVDTFGFHLYGPIPGAGPTSRVTIKPAAGRNVTIEGNWRYVLTFRDVSYVTLDGVGTEGSTTLTVHSVYNPQYTTNRGVGFIWNSDHNVIQNLTIVCDDYFREGPGIFFQAASNSLFAADSNLIQNNFIKKAGCGIFLSSSSGNPNTRPIGNIIRGNKIGSATDSVIAWGIDLEKSQNTIIENNIVQNLKLMNGANWNNINVGIASWRGNGDIIRNNVVHNVKSITGFMSAGIRLSGDAGGWGSNNVVHNNMIYDIQSTSMQVDGDVSGIQMQYQNNPKVYYNSVYLSGTGNGANREGSAALYIYSSCTNVEAKNNILVNTRDESPYCASSISNYSSSNLTSDYNDLYYEPNQYNCLVRAGGIDYHTLAEWRATGRDVNSVSEIVNFATPDLHINSGYFTRLNGSAIPITGITTDIDGQTRSVSSPDMGADEFDLINPQYWQMQNSNFPANVSAIDLSAVNNQVCWAVGQIYPHQSVPYAGYVRTTDGGSIWVCDTIPGISNGYFQQIFALDANTAFATVYVQSGQSSKGIYKTTDGGTTWSRQDAYNTSLYGPGYIHFFDAQNGVVIGDPYLETYTTTNGGLTWNPVSMPPALAGESTWLNGDAIRASGNTAWFGTNKGRLFKSTNRGYTWVVMLSEPQYVSWLTCIAFQDSLIGIYSLKLSGVATAHLYRKTTDGGVTWATLSNSILDNIAPTTLQHIPGTSSTYIVGGDRTETMRGTAITTDAGVSWSIIDTSGCFQIVFPSTTLGWGARWATNIIQKYVGPRLPTTSVKEERIDEVPTGYLLSQNYPNPFNPITTIRYEVPKSSEVRLSVFDILGREVSMLVNEEKSAGVYAVHWNANGLASGVYFYRLSTTNFVQTRKLLLLK